MPYGLPNGHVTDDATVTPEQDSTAVQDPLVKYNENQLIKSGRHPRPNSTDARDDAGVGINGGKRCRKRQ